MKVMSNSKVSFKNAKFKAQAKNCLISLLNDFHRKLNVQVAVTSTGMNG